MINEDNVSCVCVCPSVEVDEWLAEESLRYYQDCFESAFLAETGHHYRQEAARMVAELSCSQYIQQVVAQLQTVRRVGRRFLHQTSITKVTAPRPHSLFCLWCLSTVFSEQ